MSQISHQTTSQNTAEVHSAGALRAVASAVLRQQTTLLAPVVLQGVGIHSGKNCRLEIRPAAENFGYQFCRQDLNADCQVKISPALAEERELQTRLSGNGIAIATPEHVFSACAGLGLDNALFVFDAEEAPILDGSAQKIVEKIEQTGLKTQNAPRYAMKILCEVALSDDATPARIVFRPTPLPLTEIAVEMDSPIPVIGHESLEMRLTPKAYKQEIASARTYGNQESLIPLLKRSLGRGASHKNTLVLLGGQVSRDQSLRFSDEFVRHKALDLIGDLALLNAPLWGRVETYAPSHRFTGRALRHLVEQTDAWEKIPFPEAA